MASTYSATSDVPTALQDPAILAATTLAQHLEAIKEDWRTYAEQTLSVLDKGVPVSTLSRAQVLAACWMTKQRDFVDILLGRPEVDYSIPEILKACDLLDAHRYLRQLRKKAASLTKAGAKTGKVSFVKNKIHNAMKDLPYRDSSMDESTMDESTTDHETKAEDHETKSDHESYSTLTSSFAKRIKRWVGRFDEDRLAFFLLFFPTEPWKKLADYVHFSPKDFTLSYFLDAVFDSPIPPDSLVYQARNVTGEGLAELLETYPYLCECYSNFRVRFTPTTMSREAKLIFAKMAPLEDVIWNFEELRQGAVKDGANGVDQVLEERLRAKEPIAGPRGRCNFGKLMERCMTFKRLEVPAAELLLPYADEHLASMRIPRSDLKIRVLGDASSSMQVAVESATTLAALLSATLKARLSFFNKSVWDAEPQPSNALEVLDLATRTEARFNTGCADAVRDAFVSKEKVDLWVLVTDEEENRGCEGEYFASWFKRYKEEVFPGSEVFFVSFLARGRLEGFMQRGLKRLGIPCQTVLLDGQRPDSSRFDAVLGRLILMTERFDLRISRLVDMTASAGAGAGPSLTDPPSIDDPFIVMHSPPPSLKGGPSSLAPSSVAPDTASISSAMKRCSLEP